MDSKKPFGLVIPKKAQTFRPKTSGVFGSDSDDDSAPKKSSTKIPQSKPLSSKTTSALTAVDPSIYEYDSIYDEMKAEKKVEIAPKVQKSSRYIDHLLKAADKRKKEYERRVEKKVQIEREKEGDKFKDKEMFVTAGYKKKMQEREEEEERERRENMLNDMMDVTKQKDLSGFYRHFLNQSVGEEKVPVFGERSTIKEEPVSDSEKEKRESPKNTSESIVADDYDDKDFSDDGSSSSDDNGNSYEKSIRVKQEESTEHQDNSQHIKKSKELSPEPEFSKKSQEQNLNKSSKSKERHFRSNKSSSSEDDSDQCMDDKSENKSLDKHPQKEITNKRKKRSHSGDESDSEALPKAKSKSLGKRADKEITPKQKIARRDSLETSSSQDSEHDENSELGSIKISSNGVVKEKKSKETANGEKSRSIFEKRTVGEVFTSAQARYYQRLSARSQ